MPVIPSPANETNIRQAAAHLRAGRLVAFPTETVYGLGADARNGTAVAQIFAAKGRPAFNPLIIHVADTAAAREWAEFTPLAEQLAAAFWPGGLTMVLEQRAGSGLSDLISAGLPSVAIRVPSNPVALSLLREVSLPIAGPSANRSGHVSTTTAAHVATDITASSLAMILDDGPAQYGVESTIVDARSAIAILLRPGAVTVEAIEEITGAPVQFTRKDKLATDDAARTSPGQLESHYAPQKPLELNVTTPAPNQALLAFGKAPATHAGGTFNLSPSGDLIEAASNLFIGLRTLDQSAATSIAAMPIPSTGIGLAINDRLSRAAAPRPPSQNR